MEKVNVKLIRTSKEGTRQCYECDKTGCEISTRQEGTYIYQCHAGLTEVIAPIILGKIIAGYLCFGHILPKEDKREAWEIVSEKIAKYNLPTRLKDLQLSVEQLSLAVEDVTSIDIINKLPRSMTTDDIFDFVKNAY